MFSKPLLDKIHSLVDPKDLLNQNVKIKNIIDPYDNSNLLFYARGSEDILALLEQGINLQHRNVFGRNALWNYNYLLNKKIEEEIITTLLEQGIDSGITCHKGGSILSSLAFFKHPDIFMNNKHYFKNKDVYIHSFYSLTENKLQEGIRSLIQNGFKVRLGSYIDVDIKPANDFGRLQQFLPKEEINSLLAGNAKQESCYLSIIEFLKETFPEQLRFVNFVYTDMENHKKVSVHSFNEYHQSLEKSQLEWSQKHESKPQPENKKSFLTIVK